MARNLFAFLAIYEELYSINQIKVQPKKEEKMENGNKRTHLNVTPIANDDEVYVTSDIAKQLREKGFDKNCRNRFYQQPSGNIEVYNALVGENVNRKELVNTWSRPTLQMVLLWLHGNGIHPCVNWHISANKYYATITGKANANYSVGFYEEMDAAWIAIIRYSLEKLL